MLLTQRRLYAINCRVVCVNTECELFLERWGDYGAGAGAAERD